MTIAEKIKKYRKISELTQQELADCCDINVATIKKYELGQRNPKPDQITKIAKGLGVNPLIFYDFDINTVGDVMSLLFLISDITHLELDVVENEDEEAAPSVAIHFKDNFLNHALSEWADLIRIVNSMKHSKLLEDNSEIQKSLHQKVEEMEWEFRLRIMEEKWVVSTEEKAQSSKSKHDYITEDDSAGSERLGIPLVHYLELKALGRLPSFNELELETPSELPPKE